MKQDNTLTILKIILSTTLSTLTNTIIFFIITAGMTPTEHTLMFKQNIYPIIILTLIFTGLYYLWLRDK